MRLDASCVQPHFCRYQATIPFHSCRIPAESYALPQRRCNTKYLPESMSATSTMIMVHDNPAWLAFISGPDSVDTYLHTRPLS